MKEWTNVTLKKNFSPKKPLLFKASCKYFGDIYLLHYLSCYISDPSRTSWFDRLLFFRCPIGFKKERFQRQAECSLLCCLKKLSVVGIVWRLWLWSTGWMILEGGNSSIRGGGALPHCHFIHRTTSTDCKKIESVPPCWQATEWCVRKISPSIEVFFDWWYVRITEDSEIGWKRPMFCIVDTYLEF